MSHHAANGSSTASTVIAAVRYGDSSRPAAPESGMAPAAMVTARVAPTTRLAISAKARYASAAIRVAVRPIPQIRAGLA